MHGAKSKERNPYLLTWGDRWYRFKVLLALKFDRTSVLVITMVLGVFAGVLFLTGFAFGVSQDAAIFLAFIATIAAMGCIAIGFKKFQRMRERDFLSGAQQYEREKQQRARVDLRERRPVKGSLDDYDVDL